MKKLIITFLIIISAFAFTGGYHQAQQASVDRAANAAQTGTRAFFLPPSELFSGPESWQDLYPVLRESAMKAGVNLYRTSLGYDTHGTPEVIQYALLTKDTHFFQSFTLKEGRFLTPQETQRGKNFLSTRQTHQAQQVGTLKTFGKSPVIEIRPLQQTGAYHAIEGKYFVESPNQQAYQAFVQLFASAVHTRFVQEGLRPYELQVFMRDDHQSPPEGFGTFGGNLFSYVQPAMILTVVITLILLVYYGFHAVKRIGIMKLQGISSLRIWYLLIGRLVVLSFLALTVLGLIAAFILPSADYTLITPFLRIQGEIFVAVVASSFLIYPYIVRMRISDAIKNRKQTSGVFAVNTLLKIASTLALIVMILNIWSQYTALQDQQRMLQSWQQTSKTEGYGVFYPLSIGQGVMDMFHGTNIYDQYVEGTTLYPYLNQRGALYIDAQEYRVSNLQTPHDPEYIRSISVNPNYLQRFPVYTADGKRVVIPERTTDWVVLVPEKYRSKSQEILQFFKKQRTTTIQSTLDGRFSVPKSVQQQSVRIIWTANHQRVFTFDPEVAPQQHNELVDPIIQVVTENNSVFQDGLGFIGGDEASPLKVPLSQNNPEQTLKMLQPKLTELRLNDSLRNLVGVDQAISKEIHLLQQGMRAFLLVGLGLLGVSLLLVIQNLTIFFARYQSKFLVRRLFGFGFFRTYKEYLWFFAMTWIVQLLLSLAVANTLIDTGVPATDSESAIVKGPIIAGVLMLLELIVAGLGLLRMGRHNMVREIKEGT